MWRPIIYRQFWDVPRLFAVEFENSVYLLECDFDEELDDYPPNFKVHRVSQATIDDIQWDSWRPNAVFIGEVPVKDVNFDKTRRKEVDATVLLRFRRLN